MIKEINDSVFNSEVLDSDKVTVVDFWAPWCGPCRMLGPVIEELSEEMSDKVKFVKVNVDENPMSATQYRVASIPTVLVFKDGKIQETLVGFRPKQAMQSSIEKHI
ncbi:thioredoxin [Clostridium cochlearium]|jgi:thioredoxin 1|uniref:Thioredoxin n=1 Tax=Clostridium cochlearium TaxID=1494 RepID=A0A240B155_CLOCO|nr:thioredoxin [Clostridium cochlearium]MBV1817608.1 thioredoxin [Bacteroidales bacterium MSK.15.36]NSJ90194.1 thioredoxin [Coprococcus sp. MSK.21.13]MBE6065034.1 thioredoxin [Clostridium cochlearium]MBU5269875.1 thioredoxin [Clostridium cochlearium]MCG4572255.1 thioredoxin [Clostridium cochlearium]